MKKPKVKHSYAYKYDVPQPKIARITELIKVIRGLDFDGETSCGYNPRKNKNRFSMEVYFHECGTPACMSGHAIAQFSGWTATDIAQLLKEDAINYSEEGAEVLGLEESWAENTLFAPDLGENRLFMVTNAQAIAALNKLLKTIKAGKNYTNLSVQQLWGKAYKKPDYLSD